MIPSPKMHQLVLFNELGSHVEAVFTLIGKLNPLQSTQCFLLKPVCICINFVLISLLKIKMTIRIKMSTCQLDLHGTRGQHVEVYLKNSVTSLGTIYIESYASAASINFSLLHYCRQIQNLRALTS